MVYHAATIDSDKVFACQDCYIIDTLDVDEVYQVSDFIFVGSFSLIELKKCIDCGLCILG